MSADTEEERQSALVGALMCAPIHPQLNHYGAGLIARHLRGLGWHRIVGRQSCRDDQVHAGGQITALTTTLQALPGATAPELGSERAAVVARHLNALGWHR